MNDQHLMPRDPMALLVLRVWIEHGSPVPLRVFIRETSDVSLGFGRASTVTDVEAVIGAVRSWLDSLLVAEEADGARPMLDEGRSAPAPPAV